MINRIMDRSEWQGYFDQLSKDIASATVVEIEASGVDFGDQIDADWVILHGVSYDPKDDALFVMTENYQHAIPHPQKIAIDGDRSTLETISVIAGDGSAQVIRLKEPLRLSSSRSA